MSASMPPMDRMLKALELVPWQPRGWPSLQDQQSDAADIHADPVPHVEPAPAVQAIPDPAPAPVAINPLPEASQLAPLAATAMPEPAQQTISIVGPDLTTMDWPALRDSVAQCTRCSLSERRTQTVFGVGDTSASWMLIGEAPGEQEDLRGEPFVGPAGKLLDNMLAALKLSRSHDVYIANVLKCRPPGNRNPMPAEIAACDGYLQRQIQLVRPKILLLVGKFAAQTVLHSDRTVGELRNRVHQVGSAVGTIPAVVTYHPSYLLRTPQDKGKAWSDLMLAYRTLLNRQT